MNDLVERLLEVPAVWVYLGVGLLVFGEDAVFIGFLLPGQTAAMIGGVAASRGHVDLEVMAAVVVMAAIVGDSVGYEIGKHLGPRLLDGPAMARRRARIDSARDLLARRGGSAVFFCRFVAFTRAAVPLLAGISRMPYRRFLAFNALGGLVWGVGFVVLGFVAGNSYAAVADAVGRTTAFVVGVILLGIVLVWRSRVRRLRRTGA